MIIQPHDLTTECFDAIEILEHGTADIPALPYGECLPDWIADVCYPQCPHGLSLSLCVDPINHYPPDNYY